MNLTIVYHRYDNNTTNLMQVEVKASELKKMSDDDLLEQQAEQYRKRGHPIPRDISVVGILKADRDGTIRWFNRAEWDCEQEVIVLKDKPCPTDHALQSCTGEQ